jgi:hypothetical protein
MYEEHVYEPVESGPFQEHVLGFKIISNENFQMVLFFVFGGILLLLLCCLNADH